MIVWLDANAQEPEEQEPEPEPDPADRWVRCASCWTRRPIEEPDCPTCGPCPPGEPTPGWDSDDIPF